MNKSLLILRGAEVVIGNALKTADILVEKGIIAQIASPFSVKKSGAKVIDVSGCTVFPGFIDAHTHFRLKTGVNSYNADDFISGTKACAAGGITTVIDFTHQAPGRPLSEGITERLTDAAVSYCDYSFHCVVPSGLKNPEKQINEAVKMGITTFKIFTTYKERGLMLSKSEIIKLMQSAHKYRAMICVHAESEELITFKLGNLRKKLKRLGMKAHTLTRYAKTEDAAVEDMIHLNRSIGGKLYFVHISSGRSAELIHKARSAGLEIMAETCPQYLILDSGIYEKEDGHLYSFCPPARSSRDSAKLWKALKKSVIRVISTDSCAFTRAQKDSWGGEITSLDMGIASSQILFPLIYTYGVREGKITLSELKDMLSSSPARIMGLAGKGEIKVGNDADLAIFDLKKKFRVSWKNLYHKSDYSAYEGRKLCGVHRFTLLRGEVVARDGKVFPGARGKFLKRKPPEFL